MADKDKSKVVPVKNIPKDGQVILAIMKEMGITEYEPKTIVQLTEFVYRYATSILEEARMYANNSKKKLLEVDDVRLALQLTCDSTFTNPPPREVILECANSRNTTQLPLVKPHCGLRLPPDRYCLSSCNYTLKTAPKKMKSYSMNERTTMKLSTKSNVSYVKRTAPTVNKQTITIPKPTTKITTNIQAQKTVLKPKIQISQVAASNGMELDANMKRKREDDDVM